MSNILVYSLENKIYINLTNRCTNDCIFCLRKDKDVVVQDVIATYDAQNSVDVDVMKNVFTTAF